MQVSVSSSTLLCSQQLNYWKLSVVSTVSQSSAEMLSNSHSTVVPRMPELRISVRVRGDFAVHFGRMHEVRIEIDKSISGRREADLEWGRCLVSL